METNCKDCNRLIDECTCLADTVDFPKYTRDQKRRAVQECVKRLSEFEATLRLIRHFDICEQDVKEYLDPRGMSNDPAMSTTPALDPYTGQPISGWPHVEQRVKSLSRSIFDQAVEEAEELRTRAMEAALARIERGLPNPYKDWVTIEELEERSDQASRARALQGQTPKASGSLKSYTDWA